MFEDYFNSIIKDAGSANAADPMLTPEQAVERAGAADVAAWRVWATSVVLAPRGDWQRSNLWLNQAIHLVDHPAVRDNLLFGAEVFATAGSHVFQQGDVGDAILPLKQADALGRELAREYRSAETGRDAAAAFSLAKRIQFMIEALAPQRSIVPARELNFEIAIWLVRIWVEARLAVLIGDTASALARGLTAARHLDEASDVCEMSVAQITYFALKSKGPSAGIRHSLWLLHMARGEVYIGQGELESSVESFQSAAQLYRDEVVNAADLQHVIRARLNQANSLVRLSRFEEALKAYEDVETGAQPAFDQEAAVRARNGIVHVRSLQNREQADERDVRKLVADYEATVSAVDPANLHIQKAAIVPAYQLLLSALVRSQNCEDYLRVLRALREVDRLAGDRSPDSLRLLEQWLRSAPDTTLLLAQTTVSGVSFLVLAGDRAPSLSEASPAFVPALDEMFERQEEELEAATRNSLAGPSPEFIRCSENVWRLLPDSVRAAVLGSKTVVYSPDPFGNLDRFRLELAKTENGWLGLTHSIARQFSVRTLLQAGTAAVVPWHTGAKAYIVRAEDQDELGSLPGADAEAAEVERYFRLLGLEPTREETATPQRVRAGLDSGYRVFHYLGHGIAGRLGEGLPLAHGQLLQPRDLSPLAGDKTPFVYLSCCDAGRTRWVAGGRHTGLALRFLEMGAPAVVASSEPVPDGVALRMTREFYRACARHTVIEALTLARQAAQAAGIHPVCWGSYSLYGNPFLTIRSAATLRAGS